MDMIVNNRRVVKCCGCQQYFIKNDKLSKDKAILQTVKDDIPNSIYEDFEMHTLDVA